MRRMQDVYTELCSPRAGDTTSSHHVSEKAPSQRSPDAWTATRSPSDSGQDDDTGNHDGSGGHPAPDARLAIDPTPPDATGGVSLWALYRFATPREIVMLVTASVLACLNGVLYPCMALVFGDAIAAFDPFDKAAVDRAALWFLVIAVALLVTDCLAYAMFGSLSERQAKALREAVLDRLLHLDVAWFDATTNRVPQLSSRITSDSIKIKNGMGPKLGDAIKFTGQCVGGFAIGFARSWDLALVMSCIAPLSMWSMSYLLRMLTDLAKNTQQLYAAAGAVAEETLSSMRTVASLNAERQAVERFDASSRVVEDGTIDTFRRAGVVQGVFTSTVWLMYGVGLWYGGYKVYRSETPPATVFQAFFGITLGSWSLGMISPNVAAIAEAQGAAKALYAILDTQPSIDASSPQGLCAVARDSALVFHDVHFAYPSRPDAPVLRGLDVTIGPRETVAFVGPSGGGKSTILALLERFYDPQCGTITLGGHDLRALNVAWLRAQIGLVSQEPVLFAMSIFDNIAAGCVATADESDDELQEHVEAAAMLANAHEFILQLPEGYETMVGEHGTALSGGQKQRIAIARAMVRRPRFLVLDEATSALDNASERVVQEALNNVMQSELPMATIVVAHRLSTIRTADKIVVMANGEVAEVGTHSELMARDDGIYKGMVEMQALDDDQDGENEFMDAESAVQDIKEQEPQPAEPSASINKVAAGPDAGRRQHSDKQRDETTSRFTVADAMRLSAPEAKFYAIGMVAAVVHGLAMPCSALLVSAAIALMTEEYSAFLISHNRDVLHAMATSVRSYGIYYLLGACVVGSAHCVQVRCFRLMAAKLVTRLRHLHFLSLCRQDMAFFDDAAHGTGALTSDLAIQAAKVSSVSGDAQSRMVQVMATLIAAVLIAFLSGSWVLTLIMLLILPCILVGEFIRARYSNGKMLVTDDLARAGAEASQALHNVRTVMALGLEQHMGRRFAAALEEPLRKGKHGAKVNGLAIGYSSFVVFATYALVFWYGGVLVDDNKITFQQLIRTLMAIIMSSQAIGFAVSWAADAGDALEGGRVVFTVRDRPHAIDALHDDDGTVLDHVDGRLEFRNVVFRYPTRPEVCVLNDFSLAIAANETIGFCGTSGGGKSTVVALIERFYDPLHGHVLLDGHDLKHLRVSWLRRQIGYVGQEPTLFIGSIAENIAYGLDHEPSPDEIERVAKLANAHDFITQLPDGYTTQVGARGALISGGQKQRVAIARAILRNPRILLLDEATSALDSESERVVQAALDAVVATQHCTTLIIAHRLSTLRAADRICVVDHGRVAEIGPHDELVRRDGLYAKLLNGERREGIDTSAGV